MTRRIVLGVTHAMSLKLMEGLPTHLSRNWEVHVVVGQPAGPIAGAEVHLVPMHRAPSPLADARSLLRWVLLLRNLRPDVIVTGTPKAGLLGLLAALIMRVPRRVYWLRGLRAETASGFGRRLLLSLEKLAIAASTEVLVVSPSLAAEARRLKLGPAGKFVVLGQGSSNGVDVERFARSAESGRAIRERFGLAVDVPVVGFVGRLTPDKGIVVLVDALASMSVDLPVQLLAVGSEESPGLIEHLSAQLDHAAVAYAFVGQIADVAPMYGAMDVFCLPSFREGYPNVVLEAAAAHVPTVSSDATGCSDAVVDGVSGMIAPVGDSRALADVLGQVVGDPELRRRLADAAFNRVVTSFDRSVVWSNLDAFLLGSDELEIQVSMDGPS